MLPSVCEDKKMIVELHFARTDDASLIAEVKSYLITVKDIKYLRERQWINDEVINVFGKLLFGMAKKKNVYILDVYFMWELLHYKSVNANNNWAKRRLARDEKVGDININQVETFVFPIHYKKSHWLLAIADTKCKVLVIFDSIRNYATKDEKTEILDLIFSWLCFVKVDMTLPYRIQRWRSKIT